MTVPFLRRESLSQELDEALQWIESLGLQSKDSRFTKYRGELKIQESRLHVPKSAIRDSFDTAYECSDLVFICKGLSGKESPIMKRKLKALLKGPKHSSEEKPAGRSHQARDTSLELVIASHFALGGYSIEFSDDADVIAKDGKTTFYIECKRPSGTNVEGTIEKIHHQLRRRYETHEGNTEARGLAVFSVTKRLFPNSETLLVDTPEEGVNAVLETMQQFHQDTKELWYKDLDDRTMAVLVYAAMAISLRNQRGLIIARHFSGRYLSRTRETDIAKNDPDRLYFRDILSRLNQGAQKAFSTKPS